MWIRGCVTSMLVLGLESRAQTGYSLFGLSFKKFLELQLNLILFFLDFGKKVFDT